MSPLPQAKQNNKTQPNQNEQTKMTDKQITASTNFSQLEKRPQDNIFSYTSTNVHVDIFPLTKGHLKILCIYLSFIKNVLIKKKKPFQ